MPRVEDVRVIWASVSAVLEFLKDPILGLTPAELETVLAQLPDEQRRALTSKHLAWDRIPLVAINRITEEAERLKQEPLEPFARIIGRYVAERSPLIKTFAMLMTPTSTLKVAGQMWQKIYGCGRIVAVPTPTGARITVDDFPSQPSGCARVTGWLEVISEAAGAKNVGATHPQCISRHDPQCVWELTWS